MINSRVLQLIKEPQLLTVSDVEILKREVSNYPYAQSVRALYLMALYRFSPEQYSEYLPLAAVYTTDKKNLLNLNAIEEKQEKKHILVEPPKHNTPPKPLEQKKVEIKNREDLQDKEVATKDAVVATEPTLKEIKTSVAAPTQPTDMEEKPNQEPNHDAAKTSFAGTDSFLPEVSFSIPKSHQKYARSKEPNKLPKATKLPSVTPTRKPNDLLEEVAEENIDPAALNFSENTRVSALEPSPQQAPISENVTSEEPSPEGDWQEVNFGSGVPGALSQQAKTNKSLSPDKPEEEQKLEISNVSPISEEEKEEDSSSEAGENKGQESRIPEFINTWENWLHAKVPQPTVESNLDKALSGFAHDTPRIKGRKENPQYKVVDKGTDISHLMTETLAELYLKQKSYTKALDAFSILQRKHPERAGKYQEKIDFIQQNI